MVSCTEIRVITEQAEERERLKHIAYVEGIKEKTRQYCSTKLSEILKAEADKPSHVAVIYTSRYPNIDGIVRFVEKDSETSDYYSESSTMCHLDTLVKFTEEHGFTVTVIDDTRAYNTRRDIQVKRISIRW
jgi:hypothetical protein